MSDRDSPAVVEPIANTPPARRKMIWRWQWLVAPLMGVSFAMHFALLFVPIPESQLVEEEVEEEEPPEEEETLEILSLSEIPIPEPPAEPQEPEPEAPQPANDAPPTLDQVEELPDDFPEEDDFQDDDFQDDQDGGFQAKQKANQATRRLAGDNFSAASTAEIARDIELDWQNTGLSQDCFLSVVDSSQGIVEPATGGLAVHYVKRNVDLIPETLCGTAGYCSTPDAYASAGQYCGAPVYELITDGEAPLFASVVETLKGVGLAIIWENFPQ